MDVNFKVDGLQEIERQLKRLTAETAVKNLNSALMSASKPTYDRARRNASFSETFRGAIKRKKHRTLKKKTGKLELTKGFRRASSGTNRVTGVSVQVVFKKAPHFHLVELGTDARSTKKGYNRGKVKGRSMLGKAFEGDAPDEALRIFKKRMQARIKKLVKKGQL